MDILTNSTVCAKGKIVKLRGLPPPWDKSKLKTISYEPGLDGSHHLVYLTICLPDMTFYIGVCSDPKGIEGNYVGSGKVMRTLFNIYQSSDFIRLPIAFLSSVESADSLEEAIVDRAWRNYEWTNNIIDGGRTGRRKLDVSLPILVMYQVSTGTTVRGTRDDLLKMDPRATQGGMNRLISKQKGGHSDFIWCGYATEWDTLSTAQQSDHIRFNRAYSIGGTTIQKVVFDLNTEKEFSGYPFELNEIAKSLGISKLDELLRNNPGERKHRSFVYCGTLDEWKAKSEGFRIDFISKVRERFSAAKTAVDNPRFDRTEYVLLDRKNGSILIGTRDELRKQTADTSYPLRNDMFRYFSRNRRYTVLTVRSAWIETPESAKQFQIHKAMRY